MWSRKIKVKSVTWIWEQRDLWWSWQGEAQRNKAGKAPGATSEGNRGAIVGSTRELREGADMHPQRNEKVFPLLINTVEIIF